MRTTPLGTSWHLLVYVGLIMLCILGCDKETAEAPPEVVIDTTACLGSLPTDGSRAGTNGCRSLLSQSVAVGDVGTPSGCILFETPTERRVITTIWIDDRIELFQGLDNLSLEVDGALSASLFLFESGEGATQCSELRTDSPCQSLNGCLVRLGPQTIRAASGSDALIDFTSDSGMCVIERNDAQLYPPESCDGLDNDCDGLADEAVTFETRSCQEPWTADCERSGLKTCIAGEVVCSISDLPDACNGLDEDCDGNVDEDAECVSCSATNPCGDGLHCLDETCVDCLDSTHCPGSLICRNNVCQSCQGDADCGDNLLCSDSGGGPRCGRCDPNRTTTCPLGEICDAQTLSCRGCADDTECPNQVCISGTCSECDPGPTPRRGCRAGLICADDRGVGGAINCRACDPSAAQNECPSTGDGSPQYCVGDSEGLEAPRCESCRPGVSFPSNGCPGGVPICDLIDGEFSCRPCISNQQECGDNATCTLGRCEGCEILNGSNTDVNSCPLDEPICRATPNGNACSPCANDSECGRAFGDERPICREGTCQGCLTNDECANLPSPGSRVTCDSNGQCVNCIPFTSDQCGNQVCGADNECKACDDPVSGYNCATYFPGSREFCVNSDCAVCDPAIDPDQAPSNGCGPSLPVCAGQPPVCRTCGNDGECGSTLLCASGECKNCDPQEHDSTEELTEEERLAFNLPSTYYDYATNRGCGYRTPICNGDTCRGCRANADCPRGECFSNYCRISTESLCRSRGMLFNPRTQRCYYCDPNNPSACPNNDCLQVSSGRNLCGGCDDDSWCAGAFPDYPFCNENLATPGQTPIPEVVGLTPNLCRGCAPVDCEGTETPYCTFNSLACGVCDSRTTHGVDMPAPGCDDERPFCPTGEACQECNAVSGVGCAMNESCEAGVCVSD